MKEARITGIFLLVLISAWSVQAEEGLVIARAAVQREIQTGFTHAHTRLTISSEEAGRIIQVNGDVGDTVAEETPFACLDDTYLNLELQTNSVQRKSLSFDQEYFEKEVARYSKLLKKNSSTVSQLDTAQRSLNNTTTSLEALRVEARILSERKNRLCLFAPAGWQVIKRYVDPGQWVNAGEPVVEVGDYNRLSVPLALSMTEFRTLKDQEQNGIKVRLPDFDTEVPARMARVSPAFDESSRKIQFELELSDELPDHRGGMRVELTLNIPTHSGAILIQEQALRQRYEQYWLTRPDGTEVAVVYLGRSTGPDKGWVRVVSPEIKPGDQFRLLSD